VSQTINEGTISGRIKEELYIKPLQNCLGNVAMKKGMNVVKGGGGGLKKLLPLLKKRVMMGRHLEIRGQKPVL